MPYLRFAAFIAALIVAFVFFVPLQWLARRRGWRLQQSIQTGFCRVICAIIGVRVTADGALPADSPRLLVANHVSWTDVIALASLYPLLFLAKKEVRDWPVLGWLARLQGTIFVDRRDRRAVPQINAEIAARLDAGEDLVVFAEGTSSDGAGVLRFNPSHFGALGATPASVAVVPVAIAYAASDGAPVDVGWYDDMTFLPHLWSLMRRGEVRCHVMFGAAQASDGADRKILAAHTQAQVTQMLAGFRA